MSNSSTPLDRPLVMIRPSRGWSAINVAEIWRFRDLLVTLAARDLTLRYRQTALGVAWVLVQPLLAAGVLAVVFGIVARLPSGGVPPFVFSFAGMLSWGLFQNTLSKAATSLTGNAQLVSKVYFPRLVLPLSTVLSSLIDFGVALVVMIIVMIIYGTPPPGMALALLPIWLACTVMLGLALGLYAAALAVSYRDVQYVLPVAVQLMFYASPVGYAVPDTPEWVRTVLLLNPMSGLLEAFRWSLLGTPVHWTAVAYSISVAILTFVGGLLAFKRMERTFADVI